MLPSGEVGLDYFVARIVQVSLIADSEIWSGEHCIVTMEFINQNKPKRPSDYPFLVTTY